MRKTDLFRNRPMPPAIEVVVRHGQLDRLIKCRNPQCRGRHYESLITAEDVCLNCGTRYDLSQVEVQNKDLLVERLYGHVRYSH